MGKLQKMVCLKKIFACGAKRVGEDPHTPRRGGPLRPLSREISVPLAREKRRYQKSRIFLIFWTANFAFFLRLSQKMSATLRFHQN